MGTLYLVATPIGNLEDITLRALRVLTEVRLIAAEDTRKARRLLSHYRIPTKATSYHRDNEREKLGFLLGELERGDLALVSEAGTPTISDPGFRLVERALEEGHAVVPLPGPSAITAALAASGLPGERFLYLGFLPRRASERLRLLEGLAGAPYTLLAFEAPHRLKEALTDMRRAWGDDRRVAIARELTKLHEEIVRGTLAEVAEHFQEVEPRGEFTLVVEGAGEEGSSPDEAALKGALAELEARGVSLKDGAKILSGVVGLSSRRIYRLGLEGKKRGEAPEAPEEGA